MTSVKALNLSRLTMPDSNAFRRTTKRNCEDKSEKLVASVTNDLRDIAVEQIDIHTSLYSAKSRERAVINVSRSS